MADFKVHALTLRDLKTKFTKQEYAVPDIQRLYVWKKTQVLKLMDSIYKNYPIGITLIWTADYSQAINIRQSHKTIIPAFNKRAKKVELIIDGQQRLSTLYGIMFGVISSGGTSNEIDFNNLYFNCDKNDDVRFLFSKKHLDVEDGFIQLKQLIETSPSTLRTRLKLKKWQAAQVEKCYRAFHSYKVYQLSSSGLDYDDVREVFVRVNSAGMTVSRADTLFARASNVDLRHRMEETQRSLRHGYNNISVDVLQNVLGLIYGATSVGKIAIEPFLKKIESETEAIEFAKKWKKIERGYQEAADFLVTHLKILNASHLPSQNIFAILSFFFFQNQSRANTNQTKEIKKWFWHTACGERYSGGGFNKNIPEDIKFFKRLASGNAKYSISEKIAPYEFLKTSYKNQSSSSGKAYFILLKTKKPRYLLSNEEIILEDPSSRANRKDRHHIYPYALLARKQVSLKWINSIANICYLEADENQSFSDNHPRNYLAEHKKKRHFGKVMASHLIPYKAKSPIWSTDIRKGFHSLLNERGKLIITEIERAAGTKIFHPFDGIRRIY